jgi:hypothetical protein
MIVNYSTFDGTAFTSDVHDFKGLITDIRKQLDLDTESKITIACKRKVYREPHASLEDLLAHNSPILIRYNLSKAALEKRKEARNKIKVSKKSDSALSSLITMDDCASLPSINDNPIFRRLFNQGHRHYNVSTPSNPSVTVEDEPAEDESMGAESVEERKEQRDIVGDFVMAFAIDSMHPALTQPIINAIAELFVNNEAPWITYRESIYNENQQNQPRTNSLYVDIYIAGIRGDISRTREFISTNYQRSPELIISMITGHIISDVDREENINIRESDSDDVSDSDNDSEDELVELQSSARIARASSHRVQASPPRERSLSPSERTTIEIICDMLNIGPNLAESAFRQGGFDQSRAVDILMNQPEFGQISPLRNPIRRSPPMAPLRATRSPNLSERLQSQYAQNMTPATSASNINNHRLF